MLFSIDTIHESDNYRIKDRENALVFQRLCVSNNNTRKMISDNLKYNWFLALFSNIYFTDLISEFEVPLSLYRSLDPKLEFQLFKNDKYRQGGTLLFHWSYGIGSAFASEGKILKSGLGRFGEVGHWQVKQGLNKMCCCGSFGCLETEAALLAILPKIKEVYPDSPDDEPEFNNFIQNIAIGNYP